MIEITIILTLYHSPIPSAYALAVNNYGTSLLPGGQSDNNGIYIYIYIYIYPNLSVLARYNTVFIF